MVSESSTHPSLQCVADECQRTDASTFRHPILRTRHWQHSGHIVAAVQALVTSHLAGFKPGRATSDHVNAAYGVGKPTRVSWPPVSSVLELFVLRVRSRAATEVPLDRFCFIRLVNRSQHGAYYKSCLQPRQVFRLACLRSPECPSDRGQSPPRRNEPGFWSSYHGREHLRSNRTT